MNRKVLVADGALLTVTAIWGWMFVVVKVSMEHMDPLAYMSLRFFIALLCMLAYWYIGFRKARLTGTLLLHGGLLGSLLFVGFACQLIGLRYTTVSKAGFITGLTVFMVPVLSRWIIGTKWNARFLIGAVLAFLGICFFSLDRAEPLSYGDLIVFGCTFAFALHIVLTERYTCLYAPASFVSVQMLTVAILSLAASLLTESPSNFSPSLWLQRDVLKALLAGGLLATAFAYWAQTRFQKDTSANHTALIFTMEPVFASGAAVLWLAEKVTVQMIAGSLLMMAGILIAELGPGTKKEGSKRQEGPVNL